MERTHPSDEVHTGSTGAFWGGVIVSAAQLSLNAGLKASRVSSGVPIVPPVLSSPWPRGGD